MDQNGEHTTEMKQGEYSTASLDAGATEVKQLNPGGPDQRQSIKPPPTWKLYAGAIIKSEARPAGVQLKRAAKLLTVIGLTTSLLHNIHVVSKWLFS